MNTIKFSKITIYRSVYEYINSNMYIIIKNGNAIVVDPHKNDEVYDLLLENNVKNITIMLTHEHTDHISGLSWLKENFNSEIISTKYCSEYLANERLNRPILATFILEEKDRLEGTHLLEKFNKEYKPFINKADKFFEDEFEYQWANHNFKFKKVLGHSKGSCCIILDEKFIFTGDSLLKDLPVITRFPGGSKKDYKNFTIPFFEKLNPKITILPGHGDKFTLENVIKNNKLEISYR